MKHRERLAVAIAAAMAMALVGCSPTPAEKGSSTLTVAGPTAVGFNPIKGISSFHGPLVDGVYDQLIVIDYSTADIRFSPSVATEWEVSDDQRSALWTIRDDVTFSDGTHLDAAGVVTILNAIKEGGVAGPVWAPLTFTATGDYTFRMDSTEKIILNTIGGTMQTSLASPVAIVQDPKGLDSVPVGSGPYLLEEGGTPGVEATLIKNPDHWNADAYPFDTIVVKTFEDNVAAFNALRSGQIDATPIDLAAAAEAESAGLAVHTGGGFVWAIYFGDRAGEVVPAIGDVRVRQAINMAFDRETISETIELGYGSPSSQLFVEGQPSYLEGREDEYPFDPDAARELLAEAGYPDGFDLVIPSTSYVTRLEPVVQQSLADIGIRVTYETFPEWEAYNSAINEGRFAVMIWADLPNWNWFFEPGYLFSEAWPLDPRVTELLALTEGEAALDGVDDEAAAASREIGELVLEEAWFAPITRTPIAWATIPDVRVSIHPAGGWTHIASFQEADD